MARSMIAIVDLGSNQNAFIARELRKLGVYSEIFNYDVSPEELKNAPGIQGIIVNGGPNHVLDGKNIDVDHGIYALGLPVLKAGYSGSEKADVEAWDEDPSKQLDAFIAKTGAERNWSTQSFIDAEIEALRKQIGSRKVLLALSGGVDSSVVAALLIKAVGDQLTCVHVNHGLLRKNESEQVIRVFKEQLGANLIYVDAIDR
ncbi:MAG: glutamine-hydrolyzing GMP synthase, partial [Clostridia bacterium]|nr:glutamine-hydrolyzing GMP synthase [Clostridia bacterium]